MRAIPAAFQCIRPCDTRRAAVVRFNEDPDILRGLVHLDDGVGENADRSIVYEAQPGACFTPTMQAWSTEGDAKMMTVVVNIFEAARLTVSENKTETMLLRTSNQKPLT